MAAYQLYVHVKFQLVRMTNIPDIQKLEFPEA